MPLTSPECENIARRWKYAVYAVGLVLPLLGFAGTAALRETPWWQWPLFYPVAVLEFSWPFYVLAQVVAKRIRTVWSEVAKIHWASAGALIGLTVPYLFGYWSMRDEYASDAPDGQGIGIYLGAFAPIFGCGLALVGWFVGAKLSRMQRGGAGT